MKKIILTGDRPTGKLHIGHYVGSLKMRVELQNSGEYEPFIFLADIQALTDHADKPEKIRDSIKEVMLDYLSCGLDPQKSTLFIQSQIPELCEITTYLMNLVTVSRLSRNPTVKEEIGQKNMGKSIPVGFFTYPISQAADIVAFKSQIIPVGDDQLPMIEQTREVVRTFNSTYKPVLVEPEPMIPSNKVCRRLPGTDGKLKMSKSIGNCIYLSDSSEEVKEKVMKMYTDPNHIRVEDPGQIEGNAVFTYLDALCEDRATLKEMKEHYQRGGLGDVKVKKYLIEVLEKLLTPIRERRKYYEEHIDEVYKIFEEGSKKARVVAQKTLKEMRNAIGIDYFD